MNAHQFARWNCIATLALGLCTGEIWPLGAQAAEPITVELHNGHIVQGETDLQTDDRLLWLRRESSGLQLISGFPWDQVRLVRREQQTYSGHDFIPIAREMKSAGKTYAQIPSAN